VLEVANGHLTRSRWHTSIVLGGKRERKQADLSYKQMNQRQGRCSVQQQRGEETGYEYIQGKG
jgi:hypothetical protein